MGKTAATKRTGETSGAKKKRVARNLHVVPHADGWVVRRDGSTRANSLHVTQREAVEAARTLAKRYAITVVIHGRDGRVKAWNSYTRDPMPPPEPREVLYPTTMPRTATVEAIKRAVSEAISETDQQQTVKGELRQHTGRPRKRFATSVER